MSTSDRRRRTPHSLAVDAHDALDSSRGSVAKMSARSSSGSWSGGGGAPPDIIDLDKFMRSAVRPARPEKHIVNCDELVVDAGGVDRKPGVVPLAAAGAPVSLARAAPRTPAPPAPALSAPSSSSACSGSRPPPHAKRFSHDSGLSDGSYARRKHRPHRRAPAGDASTGRGPRTPAGSSNSLRAFRAVCERALLDQQAQIARVAQLCERLTERPLGPELPPPAAAPAPAPAPAPVPAAAPRRRSDRSLHSASPDTSDVSSSSRSTRDQRRKDKHRTEECKTYKIIMNKLDELNRLFAARARSPAARAPRRPAPSSGSVSVSDKLVATEPEPRNTLQVNHNTVSVRGGSGAGCAEGGAAGAPPAANLRLNNPCALDVLPRHDFVIDSVAHWETRGGSGSSGGDPRCGFDLEDPVHLYSQAKRLQALPATMRRARSVEGARRGAAADGGAAAAGGAAGGRTTLCALCRGYWRALTNFLAAQLFCYPDTA
uniref:SFRICE_009046 n=1 Tax=Spodoptera frugiperda TaxID=7108 RepID=A0A2H1WF84_SPOFR